MSQSSLQRMVGLPKPEVVDCSNAQLNEYPRYGPPPCVLNLSGAQLLESSFELPKDREILRYAILRGAKMARAKLSGVQLTGADLRKADLFLADLTNASLLGCDLRGAILDRAEMAGAMLLRADLTKASLRSVNLNGAYLCGAILRETVLTHKACLKGAILRHADLTKADLKGANLENAKLYGANLTKANLREANMTGVRLAGADLSDADLRGVKGLHLSDLRSAKHRKARGLTHVYLKGFPRELMDRYTRLLKGILRLLQRWLAGSSRTGGSSTPSRRNLPIPRQGAPSEQSGLATRVDDLDPAAGGQP